MKFKLPNFFTKADAKSRIFIVIATVLAVGFIIFMISKYLGGGATTGSSRVANAPGNLQSVPGGTISPEYYRALQQANSDAAKQASISGTSAVPTLMNVSSGSSFGGNCTTVCPDSENADVNNDINEMVRSGKLSQEDGNTLSSLAKSNVSVGEYASALDDLVKQGKLTPEEARRFLNTYKAQHTNTLAKQSGAVMDTLIKSNRLPLSVASELLGLQKNKISAEDYAAHLNRLVRDGKITADVAAQLQSQYAQQRAQEILKESAAAVNQLVKNGSISQDVADDLNAYQKRNAPVSQYEAELSRLVAAGKMTPQMAEKFLADYKNQKSNAASTGQLNKLVADAASAAAAGINDLVTQGKLTAEDRQRLLDLQNANVTPEEYQKALDKLVQEGKLTPAEAARLMADYQKLYALKNLAQKLVNLQTNNATTGDYADELKKASIAGLLTPEAAARLQGEYESALAANAGTSFGDAANGGTPTIDSSLPGNADFAKLQQRLAQQNNTSGTTTTTTTDATQQQQFAAAAAQAAAEAAARRQEQIQSRMSAMSAQAQSLITAWVPPTMAHKSGEEKSEGFGKSHPIAGLLGGNGASSGTNSAAQQAPAIPPPPPLVKAGSILFAVLDTAVNSDYPNTPVMATIVSGKFRGSKVIGKLQLESGQDRVSLNFTMMDNDSWDRTKPINAFAIDPETAHTVLATDVNHHYLLRYGSMMASSFLTGYANAISQAGSTDTSSIAGITTTHGPLSPGQKLAVGLGQVGTTVGAAMSTYFNTPTTVKVKAGVGIGILFMADMEDPIAPVTSTESTNTTTTSTSKSTTAATPLG